ncbi:MULTISPECIES: hypothetical protein [Pseudomonas]|uniref:hypothetical protein n=1 Tax=Pseudomonas TaxID=286 RepID=UPI000F0752CF|nr:MULTISPECIES: hypothetical protein [Pseudomonas]MCP1487874.1 hypothetical protein [Pseudomonas fluorescens]
MSEFTHTPGPWVLDETAEVSSPGSLNLSICSMSSVDLHEGRYSFGTASNANARLITAAPDLLKAAKRVKDSLDEWLIAAEKQGLPTPLVVGLADLKAAIAKAS